MPAFISFYKTGIKEIDEHHRILFDLVSQLHESMRVGKGSLEVRPIIDRLVDYVGFHFGYEEKLMGQYGYSDQAAHKAAHTAITKKVKEFQAQCNSQKIGLSIPLINFLKDWLINHISVEDRKLAMYLAKQGM